MLAFVCSLSVWLSQWILRREEFIIHNVFWEADGRMETWRMVAVLSSLSVKPNLLSEAPAPLSGGSDIYMFISLHLKKNENPRKAWACFVKYIYCCHIYLHMLNIQMTAPPKWFIPAGALRTPLVAPRWTSAVGIIRMRIPPLDWGPLWCSSMFLAASSPERTTVSREDALLIIQSELLSDFMLWQTQ